MIGLANPAALAVSLLSLSPTGDQIPIIEVVKVYGTLAGESCYGKLSPPGSSCQIGGKELQKTLERNTNYDDFKSSLQSQAFQWPLKPYGIEKSNDKTAVMNKGAETKLYMELLEQNGLYDPRNPTGPLPTSLRPKLNEILGRQALDERVLRILYDKFRASDVVEDIDYYGFLDLFGSDAIVWPE